MKVTKRQLRRIIREECGAQLAPEISAVVEPHEAVEAIVESQEPETELVVEMEMAKKGLEMVVESINSAANLCPGCVQEVAAAAPLIEAIVTQAEALQETMEAVGSLVTESVETIYHPGE